MSGIILAHFFNRWSACSHREYIKKDMEQLDVMIKDIQADSKWIRLLQILSTLNNSIQFNLELRIELNYA